MTQESDTQQNTARMILDEVSRGVIGKENTKEALMLALIAGGHILIEGLPGTAKTKLAHAFATAIGGTFKRLQMTPDMMPADITGFYIYGTEANTRFIPGPLFANVLLADELNRTTPRTQSALLEAMGEGQVSVEGKTHSLPQPFMVIATQVGAGAEGTYPLTDVQTDRFLIRVPSRYPQRDEEKRIVQGIDYLDEPGLSPVVESHQLKKLQQQAREVHVSEPVTEYILDIIQALRQDPDNSQGPGPRGGIGLFKCARAMAMLEGRGYVIPDDVKHLSKMVLSHRLGIKPEAEMEGVTSEMVVERALSSVSVPKVEA